MVTYILGILIAAIVIAGILYKSWEDGMDIKISDIGYAIILSFSSWIGIIILFCVGVVYLGHKIDIEDLWDKIVFPGKK